VTLASAKDHRSFGAKLRRTPIEPIVAALAEQRGAPLGSRDAVSVAVRGPGQAVWPLPIPYILPANWHFLSGAEGIRTPDLRRAKAASRFLGVLILPFQPSPCLPMFAPVTVKYLSESYRIKAPDPSESPSPEPGRSDLGVVAVLLAAGVVAEPLVAAFQPIARCRSVLSPWLATGLTLHSGIGAQPQRGVSRLHRLPNYPYQVVVQRVQGCFVAQSGREGFQGLSRVVLLA
jgi:hypothetical protein